MTRLLTLLRSLPAVAYLAAGLVAALLLYGAHERAVGAAQAETKVAQAIAKKAIAQSDSAIKAAERAVDAAAALRDKARAEAAKDARTTAAADSAIRATSAERDAARRLLEDSLATVQQLRGQVVRLVSSSRADSVAYVAERAQAERTKAALLRTVAGDSLAIVSAQGAIAKAIARAEAAEKLVKLTKPKAGIFSRCGATAGYGAVWNTNRLAAGPGVAIGCKLFP